MRPMTTAAFVNINISAENVVLRVKEKNERRQVAD